MADPLTVLIVDDEGLIRSGLRHHIDSETDLTVVGEAASGDAAVTMARALRPNVVLLDISMPGLSGIDAAPRIFKESPGSSILALTAFSDIDHVAPMIRAGARGYLLKDVTPEALLATIRRVGSGETVLAGGIADALTAAIRSSRATADRGASDPDLSPREHDVMSELVKGSTNREIAHSLNLSEASVKFHLARISAKWGLNSRVKIALRAAELGLGRGGARHADTSGQQPNR